jgi:phosphoribosylamine--glycine ligase
VLGVTAKEKDIEEASAKAYDALDVVDWPEGFYRHDIGWRALKLRHLATYR